MPSDVLYKRAFTTVEKCRTLSASTTGKVVASLSLQILIYGDVYAIAMHDFLKIRGTRIEIHRPIESPGKHCCPDALSASLQACNVNYWLGEETRSLPPPCFVRVKSRKQAKHYGSTRT
jgi:hypothetical protein